MTYNCTAILSSIDSFSTDFAKTSDEPQNPRNYCHKIVLFLFLIFCKVNSYGHFCGTGNHVSDKQKVEINENSQGDTEEKRTIRKKGTSNVETD